LPAFSQTVLIDPVACPGCLSVTGDYDDSGFVNLADYAAWRLAFGTSAPAPDGNRDGIVNAADYVIWRAAFTNEGSGATILSATVPEPVSLPLSVAGVCAARFWRRGILR
jgi:hypothetical protein